MSGRRHGNQDADSVREEQMIIEHSVGVVLEVGDEWVVGELYDENYVLLGGARVPLFAFKDGPPEIGDDFECVVTKTDDGTTISIEARLYEVEERSADDEDLVAWARKVDV